MGSKTKWILIIIAVMVATWVVKDPNGAANFAGQVKEWITSLLTGILTILQKIFS